MADDHIPKIRSEYEDALLVVEKQFPIPDITTTGRRWIREFVQYFNEKSNAPIDLVKIREDFLQLSSGRMDLPDLFPSCRFTKHEYGICSIVNPNNLSNVEFVYQLIKDSKIEFIIRYNGDDLKKGYAIDYLDPNVLIKLGFKMPEKFEYELIKDYGFATECKYQIDDKIINVLTFNTWPSGYDVFPENLNEFIQLVYQRFIQAKNNGNLTLHHCRYSVERAPTAMLIIMELIKLKQLTIEEFTKFDFAESILNRIKELRNCIEGALNYYNFDHFLFVALKQLLLEYARIIRNDELIAIVNH